MSDSRGYRNEIGFDTSMEYGIPNFQERSCIAELINLFLWIILQRSLYLDQLFSTFLS
jgi:hypothetical protein